MGKSMNGGMWCLILLGSFVLNPQQAFCQEIYVDRVHYLPASSELYLEVSFPADYAVFQKLENQTIGHPQSNESLQRRKLPVNLAQEYFDLRPFRDLLIFNESHELVCEADFRGIELFTDDEAYFVAVLRPKGANISQTAVQSDLYCLSKTAEPFLTLRFISHPIETAGLDQRIRAWFSLTEDQQPHLRHTILYPENTVYSVLSYLEERPARTYRTHSYLLETRKGELSILMKVQGETESDQIYAMQALPIRVRNRPVLMLYMGKTDTDISWTQLAVYTGSEYELREGNWIWLR